MAGVEREQLRSCANNKSGSNRPLCSELDGPTRDDLERDVELSLDVEVRLHYSKLRILIASQKF